MYNICNIYIYIYIYINYNGNIQQIDVKQLKKSK